MNGDDLYAWQELDGDEWGVVAAIVPGMGTGPVPLVTRSTVVAARMQPIAAMHAEVSGNVVRLGHFKLVEEKRP